MAEHLKLISKQDTLSPDQKRAALVFVPLILLNGDGEKSMTEPQNELQVTPAPQPLEPTYKYEQYVDPTKVVADPERALAKKKVEDLEADLARTDLSEIQRRMIEAELSAKKQGIALEKLDLGEDWRKTSEITLQKHAEKIGKTVEELKADQEREKEATQSHTQIETSTQALDEAMMKYMTLDTLEKKESYVKRRNDMLRNKDGKLDRPLDSVASMDSELARWKKVKALDVFAEAKKQAVPMSLSTFKEKLAQFNIPENEATQLYEEGEEATEPFKAVDLDVEQTKNASLFTLDKFYELAQQGEYDKAVGCLIDIWLNLQNMVQDARKAGDLKRIGRVTWALKGLDALAEDYIAKNENKVWQPEPQH